MRKGPQAPLPLIFQPRELRREDLARLQGDRGVLGIPQKLRESHHRVARLAATGMMNKEIAERTGYSTARIATLINSPAMKELIATYRQKIDEAFFASQDEYYELATANMLAAERHIRDHIDQADENDELIPLNMALKISRDAADRFGYGKHQTNTNLNVDFAKMLENAIARSRASREPASPRVIEGSSVETPALPGSDSTTSALAPIAGPATPARQSVGPTVRPSIVGPIRRRA